MKCPKCGLINPGNPSRCLCGYEFRKHPVTDSTHAADVRKLSFLGDGGNLFGIYLVNLLLTLVTFGFYNFWGKVKVRKYLYTQTEFEGDRFEFHGTGRELLIAWLKVSLIVVLYIFLIGMGQVAWPGFFSPEVAQLITMILIGVLIPVAIVGSRRYRLSRSSWRGIRFSFRGSVKEFMRVFIAGSILTGLSLGIYYPFMQNNVKEFLVRHTYIGNRPFGYDGEGSEFFRLYFGGVILTILTLGIYGFWFSAKMQRYYWEHTTLDTQGISSNSAGAGTPGLGAGGHIAPRFRSTVTGGGLLLLSLGNLGLLLITLGLAFSWVELRTFRYFFDHLQLKGALDLTAIQQEAQAASATGEGMAEFLDTGFLDIDLGF